MGKGLVKLILVAFLITFIPLASALVTLESPTILNSTYSNSSLTFSVTLYVDQFNVSDYSVILDNITCTNGAGFITQVYWDTPNANNDSASYCVVAPSSTTTQTSGWTTSIMKLLIGVVALVILILSVGGFYIYIRNNFDNISYDKIIKYTILLLLVVIGGIILINHIISSL